MSVVDPSRVAAIRCAVLIGAFCVAAAGSTEEPAKTAHPAQAVSTKDAIETVASTAAPVATPSPDMQKPAGEIFGVPVTMGNYLFAKRVTLMYPAPYGAAESAPAEQEEKTWESLILHFQSFRRNIDVTEPELETFANEILSGQQQTFTRAGDPAAYRRWVEDTVKEDVELFENQLRFIIQIRKLKDQVRDEQQPTVTETDMQQEFLNEKHHVGGEMAVFDTKDEAQAFYERVSKPGVWDEIKQADEPKAVGSRQIRPVSTMTIEAYVDLWSIPREQIMAFHAMSIGSVGAPMPFGRQWCVYKLLDKRAGDLADFPKERESYFRQVRERKRWELLQRWIAQAKADAKRTSFVGQP